MGTVGGDLATLQDLYSKFGDASTQTESLKTSVTNSLNAAVWTGPNADSFREAWEGFKKTLTDIETALTDGATDVKNQHNNIAAATGAPERI